MKKPICITFAAPVGSSKTPISNYLSSKLNLPVYNNDAVRSEIVEDLGMFDEKKFLKRRDERLKKIINNKISFICDASIDRRWELLNKRLRQYNYKWFIISIDLSENFLTKLYQLKGYQESLKQIKSLLEDHKKFLKKYGNEVALHITEENFPNRLELCYKKIKDWL